MLKFAAAVLAVVIVSVTALAQAPTLQITQPDGPNLPSELWYGNVKVKPLRFRPGTNTPITINDSDFFVSQHYIDFLSRFPDSGGLDYWANQQINTACVGDANCIYNRRAAVSASFFFSDEFQKTGYYVYRLYAGTFGRQPSFAEFKADRVQIDPSAANIEASKSAFANAWVQRPEFLGKYPNTMTNTLFVNAVLNTMNMATDIAGNNIGFDLTSQASTYIDQLNGGATRAAVTRNIIDNSSYQDPSNLKVYNSGFVLMQYFGYLRRGADIAGYNFWFDNVNHVLAGDVLAYQKMVCVFITSPEYQFRFSSTTTQVDHCSTVQ